jgi:hypothetical protein
VNWNIDIGGFLAPFIGGYYNVPQYPEYPEYPVYENPCPGGTLSFPEHICVYPRRHESEYERYMRDCERRNQQTGIYIDCEDAWYDRAY